MKASILRVRPPYGLQSRAFRTRGVVISLTTVISFCLLFICSCAEPDSVSNYSVSNYSVSGSASLGYLSKRGQTLSPSALASHGYKKLADIVQYRFNLAQTTERRELLTTVRDIQTATRKLFEGQLSRGSVLVELNALKNPLKALEGRLSYGSRPAYSELCDQLRALTEDYEHTVQSSISTAHSSETLESASLPLSSAEAGSLNLFVARILFFIADELAVPPPVAPASVTG